MMSTGTAEIKWRRGNALWNQERSVKPFPSSALAGKKGRYIVVKQYNSSIFDKGLLSRNHRPFFLAANLTEFACPFKCGAPVCSEIDQYQPKSAIGAGNGMARTTDPGDAALVEANDLLYKRNGGEQSDQNAAQHSDR